MKKYDLEDRTLKFALDIRVFAKEINKKEIFKSDIQQLVRASGSIGANYIEANEALGKKDFIMRLRISRKEAKEVHYWLQIILDQLPKEFNNNILNLITEVQELRSILSSIINKSI